MNEVDRTKLSIKQKAAELSKKTRSSFRGGKKGELGRSDSSRKRRRLPRERKKSVKKQGYDPDKLNSDDSDDLDDVKDGSLSHYLEMPHHQSR